MNTLTTYLNAANSTVLAQGYDPGVTPTFNAPWMSFFRTFGGQVIGTIIVCLVVVIAVAAIMWVISKLGGSGAGQTMGLKALGIAAIAAVIIGSAGGAVAWFSGFQIFG